MTAVILVIPRHSHHVTPRYSTIVFLRDLTLEYECVYTYIAKVHVLRIWGADRARGARVVLCKYVFCVPSIFFYTVHTERLVVDLARGGVGFEVLI